MSPGRAICTNEAAPKRTTCDCSWPGRSPLWVLCPGAHGAALWGLSGPSFYVPFNQGPSLALSKGAPCRKGPGGAPGRIPRGALLNAAAQGSWEGDPKQHSLLKGVQPLGWALESAGEGEATKGPPAPSDVGCQRGGFGLPQPSWANRLCREVASVPVAPK